MPISRSSHRSVQISFVAIAISAALAACAKSETPAADTTSPVAAAPAADTAAKAMAPAPAPAINDAQIAHIVVTANAVDSAAGELAKTKGAAKAVKDFGKTMVADHSGVNKQAVALATKLNVTPEDNDTSKQLKSGGDANLSNLQGLTGAAFDKAYIDHEVAYHQAVLDAIDKTLVPSTQNADLKALIVKVRPAFVAHLDRAKSIQTSLAK
jgi:putative membrane protein